MDRIDKSIIYGGAYIMKDGLYSKQVYWNNEIQNKVEELLSQKWYLVPTHHYYNKIEILGVPKGVYRATLYGDVIEVELQNNEISKIITRIPDRIDSHNRDICMALSIHKEQNYTITIKTLWTNLKSDTHLTINKSNYIQGV